MSNFQFIHAADLHLGAPFKGMHQNPNIAAAEKATFAAFENIIQLAIARKVLFVLFAGDILDSDYPNLWAQLQFRNGIYRLDAAGIQSCVIRGNHDHCGSQNAQLSFPESYFEFASGSNEPHFIYQNDIPVAVIYGYSYPQRAVTENILRYYQPRKEEEKYFRIGMLHANVGGDAAHDNYAPCSIAQLQEIDIDYWALGHVHQAKVLSTAPAIAYTGTPQGLSPRETGSHGCYLVTVENRECELEFVATDVLRWVNISCDIANLETEEDLSQKIEDLLQEAAQHEQRPIVARITITGRGAVHRLLKSASTLEAIQADLNGRLEFVWIDRLRNATAPDIDIEKERQKNNLLGDFLQLCQQSRNDAELQQKVLSALDDVFSHPTIKDALDLHRAANREKWLKEQLPMWLEQAEIQGADLMMEE